MCWVKVFVISTVLSLLQAQKDCSQLIRWKDIMQNLNYLSNDVSRECVHHYEEGLLCNPRQMLSEVEHNEILLAGVMKRAETMYQKTPKSHLLMEELSTNHYRLTSCANHLSFLDCEPVADCFNKLEAFLNHKKGHLHCAWEIVNLKFREILQRLEKRTDRDHNRRRQR